jgi:hypothetical protein
MKIVLTIFNISQKRGPVTSFIDHASSGEADSVGREVLNF